MKQLFKAKGDENDELKLKKKKNDNANDNIEIKIEGKEPSDLSSSLDKHNKTVVHIDVRDIEKIVFQGKQGIKKARAEYHEEDSYLNPENITYDQEDYEN